eukprot:TRINITY_DN14490_c1_g1_i1.p2 TRINITY_DN14490_c1_g1~~TRINITY_DN14490_c1_g1_i1.p2  ORF type:complete len:236 (-),score=-10.64 TRINITY_DN14490_c1_g1_i1:630-1337(-)
MFIHKLLRLRILIRDAALLVIFLPIINVYRLCIYVYIYNSKQRPKCITKLYFVVLYSQIHVYADIRSIQNQQLFQLAKYMITKCCELYQDIISLDRRIFLHIETWKENFIVLWRPFFFILWNFSALWAEPKWRERRIGQVCMYVCTGYCFFFFYFFFFFVDFERKQNFNYIIVRSNQLTKSQQQQYSKNSFSKIYKYLTTTLPKNNTPYIRTYTLTQFFALAILAPPIALKNSIK